MSGKRRYVILVLISFFEIRRTNNEYMVLMNTCDRLVVVPTIPTSLISVLPHDRPEVWILCTIVASCFPIFSALFPAAIRTNGNFFPVLFILEAFSSFVIIYLVNDTMIRELNFKKDSSPSVSIPRSWRSTGEHGSVGFWSGFLLSDALQCLHWYCVPSLICFFCRGKIIGFCWKIL